MKLSFLRTFVVLLAVSCTLSVALGQEKEELKKLKKDSLPPGVQHERSAERQLPTQRTAQNRILDEIQAGIARGDAGLFAKYLGPQVYISLKGSEGGYYSANQAMYVLQDFFSLHQPVSFSFTTKGETEETPFATGRGYFSVRGLGESAQVYVSLTRHEGQWVVAEFNVY
jgi:hypothetical protein